MSAPSCRPRAADRTPPRALLSAARGEDGFIVFGCLILIVVVFVSAVLIGKLIHGPERLNLKAGKRELRHAAAPVPVSYGARELHRLAPGDSVWVEPGGPGEVAVYTAPDALEMLGFAPDSLLVRRGAPR